MLANTLAQALIGEHVRLAALFEGWVREEPGWEVCAARFFSLVCFRHEGTDEENEEIMRRVNASGEVFLSHTRLRDRFTLRIALGNLHTEPRHVARCWELVAELDRLEAELPAIQASGDRRASQLAGRRYAELKPVVETYQEFRAAEADLADAREMLDGEPALILRRFACGRDAQRADAAMLHQRDGEGVTEGLESGTSVQPPSGNDG